MIGYEGGDVAMFLERAGEAYERSDWEQLAAVCLALASRLPPRLGLLARQIALLVDDGDHDLVPQVWLHLVDATRVRSAPTDRPTA